MKPKCPNHPELDVKAKGLCSKCYAKQFKANNEDYKLRSYARAKEWREKNPERIKHNYEKRKERQRNDPFHFSRRRNNMLKGKYGIDNDTYEEMFKSQNGCCKLCSIPEGKFKLHVDHCHTTGKVRGLLCHQCNWYLGKVDKDLGIIDRIKLYLEVA